jgi:hypothetical protein
VRRPAAAIESVSSKACNEVALPGPSSVSGSRLIRSSISEASVTRPSYPKPPALQSAPNKTVISSELRDHHRGGISFEGVIAFIFADLIALPVLDIYRKYYGLKMPHSCSPRSTRLWRPPH